MTCVFQWLHFSSRSPEVLCGAALAHSWLINIAHMIKNPHFLRTHLKFKIISQLGRRWLAFKNKLVRQET